MEKSASKIDPINLRHRRAAAFTSAIMQEIDELITPEHQSEVHQKLFELFYENGASIMTDEDRANEGLEPRDAHGWTPSERIKTKQRELEVLNHLMNPIFIKNTDSL